MLFSFITLIISVYLASQVLHKLYLADEVIISYFLRPFDICQENPKLWNILKISYIITFIFSNIIISKIIYTRFICKFISFLLIKFKFISPEIHLHNKINVTKNNSDKSDLSLLVGTCCDTSENIIIPETGLYQNFLITGTIGSGKTSSAMYPFTKQLMKYNSNNPTKKVGMLILDVKGNYYKQVQQFANSLGLSSDLLVLELNNGVFYNPLHKPNLKPQILANRLKTILTLFSENNSESYWLDKAEQVLCEAIKLCRLYNDNYVTFTELHKLITMPDYYKEKIFILRDLFISSKLSHSQIYELNSSLDFFQKEFESLDARTKAILVSEITRITNTFISDYDVMSTFCPPIDKLNFTGFDDIISAGKIVVLNINISEYSILAKIIATYLKLDFQTEIMSNLSRGLQKTTAFICDEYDKFATKTDSEFFSMSREAKCINIVSTQSYSSLKTTLKDEAFVKVILQNLINKIWFRTDDIFTIEEVQKQLGKEEKSKISRSISESAKETRFSYITNTLNSENSNISETYNSYTQNDYIFDSNFFTQNLETFTALTFLSNGTTIFKPQKLNMLPYFKF